MLLGRHIHARRVALAAEGPITRNHPPLNIAHIGLGVLIIALSFFQVRSGLEWWETLTGRGPIAAWAEPLWRAWIVVRYIVMRVRRYAADYYCARADSAPGVLRRVRTAPAPASAGAGRSIRAHPGGRRVGGRVANIPPLSG